MNFKFRLTRMFLVCCLATFVGCIEYRLEQRGQLDHYYGWANTHGALDPKLGSKAKVYFVDQGNIRPYLGGSFRKNNARINVGVIYYLSSNRSIEIGYRRALLNINQLGNNRIQNIDPFKDAEWIFYVGGVIRF